MIIPVVHLLLSRAKIWLNSYIVEIAHLFRIEYMFKSQMKAFLLVEIPFGYQLAKLLPVLTEVMINDFPFGSNWE